MVDEGAPEQTPKLRRCPRCKKNPPAIGFVNCQPCKNYSKKYNKRYDKDLYQSRRQAGVCVRCAQKQSVINKTRCQQCLVYGRNKRKERWVLYRDTILDCLGRFCVCCGNSDYLHLTLSHLNNNGVEDRTKHGGTDGVVRFLYGFIKSGKEIPVGYGIECYNCNCGKSINKGICPHKSPVNSRVLIRDRKLRYNVVMKYGGRCDNCHEAEPGFLTVEHKRNGGEKEITSLFSGSWGKFYRSLRDSPVREDITILCWNCNCSKRKEESLYLIYQSNRLQ